MNALGDHEGHIVGSAAVPRGGTITVDHEADAAHIHLHPVEVGGVARTECVSNSVNVDYGAAGVVVGVEVLTLRPFQRPGSVPDIGRGQADD